VAAVESCFCDLSFSQMIEEYCAAIKDRHDGRELKPIRPETVKIDGHKNRVKRSRLGYTKCVWKMSRAK
jgi:hypothetical protein